MAEGHHKTRTLEPKQTEKDIKISNTEKAKFYAACAEILGIEHEFHEPVRRRNRWNNRRLGNGRFPGFGLIRDYGSIVMITTRAGTRVFPSRQAALAHLRTSKIS